jgi:hypothetical protein
MAKNRIQKRQEDFIMKQKKKQQETKKYDN